MLPSRNTALTTDRNPCLTTHLRMSQYWITRDVDPDRFGHERSLSLLEIWNQFRNYENTLFSTSAASECYSLPEVRLDPLGSADRFSSRENHMSSARYQTLLQLTDFV